MEEGVGITRGEVRAIMLALTHIGAKLDTILGYFEDEEGDDEAEEEPESPDA